MPLSGGALTHALNTVIVLFFRVGINFRNLSSTSISKQFFLILRRMHHQVVAFIAALIQALRFQ